MRCARRASVLIRQALSSESGLFCLAVPEVKNLTTKVPTVGFVSLGCPKAGSDAERILTKLRAEGYEISPSYEDSDLVIVNTCGFIDAAVEESLDAIGEALN